MLNGTLSGEGPLFFKQLWFSANDGTLWCAANLALLWWRPSIHPAAMLTACHPHSPPAAATSRTMCCLLENYQTPDGVR